MLKQDRFRSADDRKTRVTVLVTGASGFIGSHLVRKLIAGGMVVRALVRAKSCHLDRLKGVGAELVAGDHR